MWCNYGLIYKAEKSFFIFINFYLSMRCQICALACSFCHRANDFRLCPRTEPKQTTHRRPIYRFPNIPINNVQRIFNMWRVITLLILSSMSIFCIPSTKPALSNGLRSLSLALDFNCVFFSDSIALGFCSLLNLGCETNR